MPILHTITDGGVLSRFEGSVDPDEVIEWYEELRASPSFRSGHDQLAHFQMSSIPEWTAADMKRVLASDPFDESSRRAFVGADDLVFALSRMFATFAETQGRGGQVSVFRSLPEACEWLGLPTTTTL